MLERWLEAIVNDRLERSTTDGGASGSPNR
jgi:hypothetical protein